MQLDTLRNAVELLEQRVYDLEMAKMVSLANGTANQTSTAGEYETHWKN